MKTAAVCASAIALGLLGAGAVAEGTTEALDYAFRFASAIQTDSKDREKAKASVVSDLASIGALDAAVERAASIEGWQRGVVYADLATDFARAGRSGTARDLLAKAEQERLRADGWHVQRIRAHVAQALAALGEVEESKEIAGALAGSDQQYIGRSVATVAAGHAARGEFDKAIAVLRTLDENRDFDVSWWRTVGYVGLARETRLAREQRVLAIEEAQKSAHGISGWKQAEALESVAEVLGDLDKPKSAREALAAAEEIVVAQPETMPVKAALLSNLARGWAQAGDAARSRKLLREAEGIVPSTVVIDRPGLYANIASTYLTLHDEAEAWRVYETAASAAESLENARPRALAAVAICRSMGRSGLELKPETRGRLDRLLGGLGEPW